jgi:hypothetical protein
MLNWPYRHHLGLKLRLRRSLYEVLRDQLDMDLVKLSLIDSYWNFQKAGEPYPFVQKRELKPKARVAEREHALQNHFFIIFCEGTIQNEHKKYIRFFDSNKMTKETIEKIPYITLHKNYANNLKYFDKPSFTSLVSDLTPVDYALLIQHDPTVKSQSRYMMTHFHVRIDWPIDDATEDMAVYLRYATKELYERGEQYAEHLQHKLFENYGFHHTVGGRRTAAVVAAQYLRRMSFISTIYVSSAEARTLTRLSERGVSKMALIRIPLADIDKLANENHLSINAFRDRYLIDMCDTYGVAALHVVYRNSAFSKPPEDNKLRRLRPDYQWLTISDQLILPNPDHPDACPLRYSTIYSAE